MSKHLTDKAFYDLLEIKLRKLKPWHKTFKILQKYLIPMGFWKAKPRGNPRKGYEVGFGKKKE